MRRTGAFIILRELGVWVSKGVHTNCLSRHKESQYPSRGEYMVYYCMGYVLKFAVDSFVIIQSAQGVTLGI